MSQRRVFSGRRRLTTDEAALRIYELLDTPVSLGCYLRLKYGEVRDLITKATVDSTDYCLMIVQEMHPHLRESAERNLAERFRKDYQAVSLLSKLDREIGIDKELVAFQKWEEAEESNLSTNDRLRFYYDSETGGYRHPNYSPYAEYLHRARKIIARILGQFKWSEAARHFGHGPGTCRQTKAIKKVDLSRKYAGLPAVSPQATAIAALAIGMTPIWFESLTGVIPVGPCSYLGIVADDAVSISFVPKNAKTFRAIGIEPLMNVYLQKGVGAVIRNRLKRVGINLDSQGNNQAGAFLASLNNGHATLDLSSASDTVSIELVKELLPDDWFHVLNSLRCSLSEIKGTWIKNQKFSSMGNGFTFELESLLFYGLSKAVEELRETSNEVLVYGDDIIVHQKTAEELIPLLAFCGFSVNEAKSFTSGYFYESCGKDFFLGYDVRPFFIRKELEDVQDYYLLYNQCRASDRNVDRPYRTPMYGPMLGSVYCSVRPKFRYSVPFHWGDDTGFQQSFDEACPSLARGRGWGVFRFPYWQSLPATVKRDGNSLMAAKLSRLSETCCLALDSHPGLGRIAKWLFPETVRTGNDQAVREDREGRRRTAVGYTVSWA